jgi:(p)ppGpp synthase/HD superfamily hydrolase
MARRDLAARIALTVEISDVEQLNRVLGLLREVPGVARAARR